MLQVNIWQSSKKILENDNIDAMICLYLERSELFRQWFFSYSYDTVEAEVELQRSRIKRIFMFLYFGVEEDS